MIVVFRLEAIEDYEDLIQVKIVYWGPEGSGKTASFKVICERLELYRLNKGLSIQAFDGTTLWQESTNFGFQFRTGRKKMGIVVQLCTTPGNALFSKNKKYVLSGADGIIFVADSEKSKSEENRQSFEELFYHTDLRKIPFIIQLNKRDIDSPISIEDFETELNLANHASQLNNEPLVYPTSSKEINSVVNCFLELLLKVLLKQFKHDIWFSEYKMNVSKKLLLKFEAPQNPDIVYKIINEKYPLERYNTVNTQMKVDRFNTQGGYTFVNKQFLKDLLKETEIDCCERLKWDYLYNRNLKTVESLLIFMFGFNIEKNGIGREIWREDIRFSKMNQDLFDVTEEWKYRTELMEQERRLLYHALLKLQTLLESHQINCSITL